MNVGIINRENRNENIEGFCNSEIRAKGHGSYPIDTWIGEPFSVGDIINEMIAPSKPDSRKDATQHSG